MCRLSYKFVVPFFRDCKFEVSLVSVVDVTGGSEVGVSDMYELWNEKQSRQVDLVSVKPDNPANLHPPRDFITESHSSIYPYVYSTLYLQSLEPCR